MQQLASNVGASHWLEPVLWPDKVASTLESQPVVSGRPSAVCADLGFVSLQLHSAARRAFVDEPDQFPTLRFWNRHLSRLTFILEQQERLILDG